jgi:molybdenum cofactor guanylyltransferase
VTHTTGAIILAGGKSERMGQDKALLTFEGMTLLEHCVANVLSLVEEVVVVADTPGKYTLSCGRVIADSFPDCGPVGGIVTGLTVLGRGAHIVLACDMPMVQPSVLQLLLKSMNVEWDAFVPEVGGQLEPLCAIYRHSAAPKLLRYLETGERSARKAMKSLDVKRIGEGVLRRADPSLVSFTNVNTPEEWEHARRLRSP